MISSDMTYQLQFKMFSENKNITIGCSNGKSITEREVCACVCVFEKEEYSIGWKTCPHSREWPKYLHYFSPKFFSGVSINIYRFLVIRGVPYLSS